MLWAVVERITEDGTPKKFILCVLYKRYRDGTVGWKDMCESMHPYQYNCPKSYLDDVPVESAEWREGVLAYHAKATRKFRVGQFIELLNCKIPYVQITQLKPLRGYYGGTFYRLPRRMLGKELTQEDVNAMTAKAA